jgi:hypothetical protein
MYDLSRGFAERVFPERSKIEGTSVNTGALRPKEGSDGNLAINALSP